MSFLFKKKKKEENKSGPVDLSGAFEDVIENGNCIDGDGEKIWPDGTTYKGSFVRMRKEGRGVINWPNGTKYVGEFQNDCRWGTGEETHPDGTIYKGEYKMDGKDGTGETKYPSGAWHKGEYKNDQKNGHGEYHYANGDVYVGGFENSKRGGEGVFTEKAYLDKIGGIQYEGGYKNDLRHGKGTIKPLNGNARTYTFFNDFPRGDAFLDGDGKMAETGAKKKNAAPAEPCLFLNLSFASNRSGGAFRAEVKHGRYLPPKDENGMSDPYVIFRVVPPPQGKKKAKEFKTAWKKMTLSPDWGEDDKNVAEFNLDASQLEEDSVARLEVECWDKDLIASDDFMGGCVIPLDLLLMRDEGDTLSDWFPITEDPNWKKKF